MCGDLCAGFVASTTWLTEQIRCQECRYRVPQMSILYHMPSIAYPASHFSTNVQHCQGGVRGPIPYHPTSHCNTNFRYIFINNKPKVILKLPLTSKIYATSPRIMVQTT